MLNVLLCTANIPLLGNDFGNSLAAASSVGKRKIARACRSVKPPSRIICMVSGDSLSSRSLFATALCVSQPYVPLPPVSIHNDQSAVGIRQPPQRNLNRGAVNFRPAQLQRNLLLLRSLQGMGPQTSLLHVLRADGVLPQSIHTHLLSG